MRITKFGHACVRLQQDGRAIVIDPGVMTVEPDALAGVEAVFITHEHFDHFDPERLHGCESPIYTCAGVARRLSGFGQNVRVVSDGDRFSVAGFEVSVAGDKHHFSHPDVPPVDNVGS
ncbi:MBL fold metallo-hydrolase [Streptomyces sp. NPDC001020]